MTIRSKIISNVHVFYFNIYILHTVLTSGMTFHRHRHHNSVTPLFSSKLHSVLLQLPSLSVYRFGSWPVNKAQISIQRTVFVIS